VQITELDLGSSELRYSIYRGTKIAGKLTEQLRLLNLGAR